MIDVWYLPTNYGDIRLESTATGDTKLMWWSLTAHEKQALENLRDYSSKGKLKRWSDGGGQWEGAVLEEASAAEHTVKLFAPISSVATKLTEFLHADRDVVHVVRIGNGKIEEVVQGAYEYEAAAGSTALAKRGTSAPVKATTVKKPVKGCPAPAFEEVRRRATQVMRAFLTPQQAEDFRRYQRFMTVGGATGHVYMLTSRNAPGELRHYGGRTVYDCDEREAICVHDWDIPAEEELLTMHALLSLPQYEGWIRDLPE